MSYTLYYWPGLQGRGEFVRLLIGQTANILYYLGGRHGLAPRDEAARLWVNQLQLTIADFTAEGHDTHHPIAVSLTYSQQKKEALRRTRHFLDERVPRFFDYFETVIERNRSRGPWMAGARLSYADLSLAQVLVDGIRVSEDHAQGAREARGPRAIAGSGVHAPAHRALPAFEAPARVQQRRRIPPLRRAG